MSGSGSVSVCRITKINSLFHEMWKNKIVKRMISCLVINMGMKQHKQDLLTFEHCHGLVLPLPMNVDCHNKL